MMESRPDEPCAAVRRYYLVMAAPFAIDVVIAAIFSTVVGDLALFVRNLVIAAVVLLLGVELAARRLFRPIQDFLDGKIEFAAIERRLTQLPLLSARVSGLFALPLLLFRIIAPLAFADVAPPWFFPEVPHSAWLDAILTVIVQTIFTFVFMYFLVSGYLETLCLHLFERHGVNLRLFFGRFPLKIAVALIFSSIAPLILMVGEVVSYEGSRLMTEVTIDFSASIFALGITYFWVSRSLTRPVARLDAGMRQVAAGNLEQRLPVTSNEEIGQLTSHFNDMVEGLRERRRIRETFGKYVSESVASALLKDAEGGRLAAETREATLVFTDIEGFTPLAEELPPDVLIGVLNEYLELVMAPIQAAGGVINNFVGDGLFASFNLPLADPDHAAHAVAAALGIRAALEGRLFAGRVRLKTRIGINTGLVVGGTVGAGDRLSYTLLGDAVNTAARLQELAKTQGTDILVAEATRARAGEAFRFRSLGEVAIRGRIGAMTIFTVDGPTKE